MPKFGQGVPVGGTTGQELQKASNTDFDTAWVTPPAGGSGALTFLEAHSASTSATLDFTAFISSTYDTYLFKIVGLIPATSTSILYMRMGTGAGPTYDTGANYGAQVMRHNSGAAAFAGADSGLTQIQLTTNWLSTGSHPIAGTINFYGPQNATLYKFVGAELVYPDSGINNMVMANTSGQYNSATAVTAVRFYMSAGNITSGTIRVYGITKT